MTNETEGNGKGLSRSISEKAFELAPEPTVTLSPDRSAVHEIPATPSSIARVGEVLNSVVRVGEALNNVARADEALNSVARVGEALNGVARVGEALNSVARVGETLNSIDSGFWKQVALVAPMLETTTRLRSIGEAIDFSQASVGNRLSLTPDRLTLHPLIVRDQKLDTLVDMNGVMTQVADLLENQSHLVEQLVDENRLLRQDQKELRDAVNDGRRESKRGNRWLILLTVGLLLVGVVAAIAVVAPDLAKSFSESLARAWHWVFG
jgi:hypothetical protein